MSVADHACASDFAQDIRPTRAGRPAAWHWPNWLTVYFRRQQARYQLSLMSARQLADIGIDPEDIAGGMERLAAEQQMEEAERQSRRLLR